MPLKPSPKTWFATGTQNLVRHSGGTYYARLYRDGKATFKSLGTKTSTIAKIKLQQLKTQHQISVSPTGGVDARTTFRTYLNRRREAVDRMVHRAPRTRDFYHECLVKIENTWGAVDRPLSS